MSSNKHILVVGGAGYVGSHVNKILRRQGYRTTLFDNLSMGNREAIAGESLVEGDLGDPRAVADLFAQHQFDAVMHFAALAQVGESFERPLDYYHANVGNTIILLEAMARHEVKNLIFSSSAAIFGNPQSELIDEEHLKSPVNPYGWTKLIVEQMLADCAERSGLRYGCLRYFNAAGGDPEGELLQRKRFEQNLIPIVLKKIVDGDLSITVNGSDYPTPDGTCVRDYVHVADIAQAHIAAMEQLISGKPHCHYNLGSSTGHSIREILTTIEGVTGIKLQINIGPRRRGDPPQLIASHVRAKKELDWQPRYPDIETIVTHQWQAICR